MQQTLAEKIFDNLYRKPEEAEVSFTPKQLETKKMSEDVFAKLLETPDMPDRDVVYYMINQYGTSQRQAYNNISTIKSVLGNVRNAAKEWHRYTVIKMLKEAFKLAKDNNRYKEMIMAADKLGKYTKLDKDEIEEIPWDQILPPAWEPTADPSVLNISIPENLNEHKEKLRRKYLRDKNVQEATIIADDVQE